jgi:hypothetical protein
MVMTWIGSHNWAMETIQMRLPLRVRSLYFECVDDFIDDSLQYERCSLTPLSPPPCSNVPVNAPRVPKSFPQTTCLHRHGHFLAILP